MTKADDAAYARANAYSSSQDGISKREYFAAMAMQGLIANQETYGRTSHADIATDAVLVADALIAALNSTH